MTTIKTEEVTKSKVLKGVLWSFLDRGSDQILRFILSIILARLLMPEHFGLIVLIEIIFEIAVSIINSGFGVALINKKSQTYVDECTVFYFNIMMSVICFGLVYLLAPVIAEFYGKSELVLIIRVMSISLITSSFSSIQNVMLMKRLDFKRLTIVSTCTTVISGCIGIALAFNGYGVWALVIQYISRSIISVSLLWYIFSWRPALIFNFTALRNLFAYGSKMFLSSIISILFNNIHNIIIGKLYSLTDLGFFSRGRQLQQIPINSLSTAIGRVTFPTMSLLKNDTNRFVNSFRRMMNLIALGEISLMLLLAACSKNIVLFLYGAKWIECEKYFQIFCILGAFSLLDSLINNTIAAYGKSNYYLSMNIFQKVMIVISIFISYKLGIIWMTRLYVIAMLISFIINFAIYCRIFHLKLISESTKLVPYIVSGFLTFLACRFVLFINMNLYATLSLQIAVGIFTSVTINFLLKSTAMVEMQDIFSKLLRPKQKIVLQTNATINSKEHINSDSH